jgi:hypothetical protein
MQDPASGLRRMCIPGTSVNRVASVSARGGMYQEQSNLRDALVYKGTGASSGLGKERIILLGQSPSPEKAQYGGRF